MLILLCSAKVSLATDFMYNYMSRDVTASVGYDYILRQVSVVIVKVFGIMKYKIFQMGTSFQHSV